MQDIAKVHIRNNCTDVLESTTVASVITGFKSSGMKLALFPYRLSKSMFSWCKTCSKGEIHQFEPLLQNKVSYTIAGKQAMNYWLLQRIYERSSC